MAPSYADGSLLCSSGLCKSSEVIVRTVATLPTLQHSTIVNSKDTLMTADQGPASENGVGRPCGILILKIHSSVGKLKVGL